MQRKITQYLIDWKHKKDRKPLIVRGARQVGKTYSVLDFGQNHYQNLLHINLDSTVQKDLFASVKSVQEFIETASVFFKVEIKPGQTLIFIDEIQNLPHIVHLLRFFYEENPEYHLIAAGSLFGNYLAKEKISMPVGRVEYVYMYPLDFFEFLQAIKENDLLKILKNVVPGETLSSSIHKLALNHFYKYLMVGGMPELVVKFYSNAGFLELEKVFNGLFESYLDDVDKYASLSQRDYIKYALKQAPLHAGQSYNYTSFGGGTYSSVEISHAFRQIEASMLVSEVLATNSSDSPLIGQRKRAKKMVFIDVGLSNFKSFNELLNFANTQLSDIFRGRAIEQFVGQSLLSLYQHKKLELLYWARNKDKAQAEVDFTFTHQGKICGVEVKSGSTGKLKSLYSFAQHVSSNALVRVHTGELKLEDIVYQGKKYQFYSLPVYLMPRILEFV